MFWHGNIPAARVRKVCRRVVEAHADFSGGTALRIVGVCQCWSPAFLRDCVRMRGELEMAHRARYRDAPPNHMSPMHGYGHGYSQHDGGEFREARKRGFPDDLPQERAPRRCLDRVSAPAGRHHGWEDSPGRRPSVEDQGPDGNFHRGKGGELCRRQWGPGGGGVEGRPGSSSMPYANKFVLPCSRGGTRTIGAGRGEAMTAESEDKIFLEQIKNAGKANQGLHYLCDLVLLKDNLANMTAIQVSCAVDTLSRLLKEDAWEMSGLTQETAPRVERAASCLVEKVSSMASERKTDFVANPRAFATTVHGSARPSTRAKKSRASLPT